MSSLHGIERAGARAKETDWIILQLCMKCIMGFLNWIVSTLQECICKCIMGFLNWIVSTLQECICKFLLIHLRSTKISVGLFTRDGKSEYSWLIDKLQSQRWCTIYVQPFQISNRNWSEFQEAVAKCQFAILYHSNTRGRINITDVTDSIYNEELDTLYKNLGKEKVTVVVDHMERSNDDDKAAILRNQPSIAYKAQDVFLFSTEETMPHGTKALHYTGEKNFRAILALIAECILFDYSPHRGPFTRGLRGFVSQLCGHPIAFIQLSLRWCLVQSLLLIVEKKILVRTILA
ncbi:uncharacterized protein LOC108702443 isoform X2 [Xenopus laevis]|uniref:Uncharacterized protein LOC108702443 isoform X2 n=1 Tax=Xenopus laevis TaxID=8355 RepID=A0A8J1LZ94_XENLA|nr:uncharacterized protein LOC108702443 isoform X2 [Xenopus laevis]